MRIKRLTLLILVVLIATVSGCAYNPNSSDVQRDRQEKMVSEGVAQTGLPAIKNFRELKLAKDIYEMRDQTGLVTYSYLWSDVQGRLIFLCNSIGYPIPYGVQITAPESIQRYYLAPVQGATRDWGHERLPQAEPNGLFSPSSAEGSWVMCKDPHGKDVRPIYTEPRVIVSQFKLE